MPLFSQSYVDLIGAVVRRRPAADRSVVGNLLNEKMRSVLDMRNEWNGLIKPVTVSFPPAYSTGTVNFAIGSNIVQGTGTNWPVNDAVNTTIAEQINGPQQKWVTPASMAGITRNSIVYVDAGQPNPEILPVLDILGPRILLNFQQAHAANFSCQQSSFANLQFRLDGFSSPIYTILAITDPQTMVVDQICGQSVTNGGYWVLLMYITIDPQVKDILTCYDPFQMLALTLDMPQTQLNLIDPNRTATNSPIYISPRYANANGLMTWEVWPPSYIQYQLQFEVRIQWPDMRIQSDYPPPFMNPNVLIYGALADLHSMQLGRPPTFQDPGYDLNAAARYDGLFNQAFQALVESDEARKSSMFTFDDQNFSYGSTYLQSHELSDPRFPN